MHDNTNLAQATIAVWHSEIENYNSAQQSQFEQCTKEIPITYHSRVSPFWSLEKNNSTNNSIYMPKSSAGGVCICSTLLVEQASPPHLLKAADIPISKLWKPAVREQPGSQQESGSARASAGQHLSHPSSCAAHTGWCQQHRHFSPSSNEVDLAHMTGRP